MIDEWNEMKARHEQEIAGYLQRMADQGYSRSQAAQLLGKNTSSITHLVKKYKLRWPRPTAPIPGRKGYEPDDYRKLAEAGHSKSETARILGVNWNTVHDMGIRHRIVFKDGRPG